MITSKTLFNKKWGVSYFKYSDSINWVEYYEDNNVRSTVNFKDGSAYIELLVEPDEAVDRQKIDNDDGGLNLSARDILNRINNQQYW